MKINELLSKLIDYGIKKELINEDDINYTHNKFLYLLNLEEVSYQKQEFLENDSLEELLSDIGDLALKGKECDDFDGEKDQITTLLIDVMIDKPSIIHEKFWNKYAQDKQSATKYFYELSKNSNYIKTERIAKNISYNHDTKYTPFEITINLSKPEKDPKEIEKLKSMTKQTNYPTCPICAENEGYYGRINYPDRSTHRIIPITLNNQEFAMHYSPYIYYNEHMIIIQKDHVDMKINRDTFTNFVNFLDMFPHYFIGSNSDIPLVGGSILTHNHYQAGCHKFPIDDAKVIETFKNNSLTIEVLKWPLSVIRVRSDQKDELVDYCDNVLQTWINYENQDLQIIKEKDGKRCNSITIISRMKNGKYEFDLVLRNNIQTKEYPDGLFHVHPQRHHIKKENIGLIEVIGLAILPGRLKNELEAIEDILINNKEITPELKVHEEWIEKMQSKNIDPQNIKQHLKEEVANIFELALEDTGVFKQNQQKELIDFTKLTINQE